MVDSKHPEIGKWTEAPEGYWVRQDNPPEVRVTRDMLEDSGLLQRKGFAKFMRFKSLRIFKKRRKIDSLG